jgi:hypothetical protein
VPVHDHIHYTALMAPVYTCPQNNGVSVAAFKERGIGDLMPGPLDDVPIFIVPKRMTYCILKRMSDMFTVQPSIPFLIVMAHIQHFAFAQLTATYTVNRPKPRNVFRQITSLPHIFDVPVVQFVFGDLSEDEKGKIRSFGLREEPGKGTRFIGTPSASHFTDILKMGPTDARSGPGMVTPRAYMAYIILIKAVMCFTSLSHGIMSVPGLIKRFTQVKDKDGEQLIPDLLKTQAGTRDKTKLVGAAAGDIIAFDYTLDTAVMQSTSKVLNGTFIDLSETASLAASEGIFFSYFLGMIESDKSLPVHVFRDHFLSCIGDSEEDVAKVWASLRNGIKELSFYPAGKALCHIFLGISLAMKATAPMTIVLNGGSYAGFVLHGELSVSINGKSFRSVDAVQLQEDLGKVNLHAKRLQEICVLINSAVTENGTRVYSFEPKDISTSRGFVNVYNSLDLDHYSSTEFKTLLRDLVEDLRYTDTFTIPTPLLVKDFLNYVLTGDNNHISKYPAFLGGNYYESRDRVSTGLGIFGPKAPSLNYGKPKDMSFTLPSDLGANDPNLAKNAAGKAPLPYLPFAFEPVKAAGIHWHQLFSDGKIKIPSPRRNKEEFTNSQLVGFKITGEPMFSEVYSTIKRISSETRAARSAGKRGREDTEVRGTVKKSRKETAALGGLI